MFSFGGIPARGLGTFLRSARTTARSTFLAALGVLLAGQIAAQTPTLLDKNLDVRPIVDGLTTPTTLVFLDEDDFLILEKNTGQVKRVIGGAVQGVVLDLAVNFASERGALGIALHPDFPADPGIYIFWTESSLGVDTNVTEATPLLGNRVDRFLWANGALSHDKNIIMLRALQPAFAQEPVPAGGRGNHDGGVIKFGPDGKLYVFIGDVGRRGLMQNVLLGRGPDGLDDPFGGPAPSDAHLTGVILRLNDDGSTPTDNPFYEYGAGIPQGGVGENIQKIFSYGHRNGFGFDFDPVSGELWLAENGDDTYSEINRVLPGMNSGWIQIMGPVSRTADRKAIETSMAQDPFTGGVYYGLQQARWDPTLIPDTPKEALAGLFMLPGAHYADPVLSWRYVVEPAALGFLCSSALGRNYEGDIFLGGARDFLLDGHLFRLKLTGNRRGITGRSIIDNAHKWDGTGSEHLLFGHGFGIVTDIQTAPNGNLVVVSLSHGAVYEIFEKEKFARKFDARLSGGEEVPPVTTRANGKAMFTLDSKGETLSFQLIVANIQNVTMAHIHVAGVGVNGPVVAWLYPPAPPAQLIAGRFNGRLARGTITSANLVGPLAGQPLPALLQLMQAGQTYVNVHTNQYPAGEIRGQIRTIGRP